MSTDLVLSPPTPISDKKARKRAKKAAKQGGALLRPEASAGIYEAVGVAAAMRLIIQPQLDKLRDEIIAGAEIVTDDMKRRVRENQKGWLYKVIGGGLVGEQFASGMLGMGARCVKNAASASLGSMF